MKKCPKCGAANDGWFFFIHSTPRGGKKTIGDCLNCGKFALAPVSKAKGTK